MRHMHWSWAELQDAPGDVVERVLEMLTQQAQDDPLSMEDAFPYAE